MTPEASQKAARLLFDIVKPASSLALDTEMGILMSSAAFVLHAAPGSAADTVNERREIARLVSER